MKRKKMTEGTLRTKAKAALFECSTDAHHGEIFAEYWYEAAEFWKEHEDKLEKFVAKDKSKYHLKVIRKFIVETFLEAEDENEDVKSMTDMEVIESWNTNWGFSNGESHGTIFRALWQAREYQLILKLRRDLGRGHGNRIGWDS